MIISQYAIFKQIITCSFLKPKVFEVDCICFALKLYVIYWTNWRKIEFQTNVSKYQNTLKTISELQITFFEFQKWNVNF